MGGGHKFHDLEAGFSSCPRISLSLAVLGLWSTISCDLFLSPGLSVESHICCRLDPCRMFLSLQHSACQSACSVEFKKGKKAQNCPFHPQLFEQHPKISSSTCLTTLSAQASWIIPLPNSPKLANSLALSRMPWTNSSHSSWHKRFKEHFQATSSKRP